MEKMEKKPYNENAQIPQNFRWKNAEIIRCVRREGRGGETTQKGMRL
jgi:hypothetical protein